MKCFVAAAGACLWIGGSACSDVSFVDEVTIVNDTEYSADIDVTDKDRDGWLSLITVQPESTASVQHVIDQGQAWIFRFDYIGKHEEEGKFSRGELERSDWTIEVPESFELRLRDLDVPPPP